MNPAGKAWLLRGLMRYAGVMGKRTEHQAEDKAQLMVTTSREGPRVEAEAEPAEALDQVGSEKNVLELSAESAAQEDVLDNIRVADGAGTHCCFVNFSLAIKENER